MTLHELSQLYYLNREIANDRRRLAMLRDKAYAASSPNLSGMPSGSGSGDRVGKYAAEIAELEALIEIKLERCMCEQIKLERYIADIPDSLTRQIFTYRFIDKLSWTQVARRVGGDNTADSVKKNCYRYLEKIGEK